MADRTGSAVAVLALACAAVLLVLRPLSVASPGGGLDASWMAVLGEAAAHRARWGIDLAFTYGPASALVTRYFTEDYASRVLPFTCAIALVGGSAFTALARRGAEGRSFAAAAVFAAVAAQIAGFAAMLALDQDSFYFVLALTVLLLDIVRRPGERVAAATVTAGAALLGASALVKTSFGVAAFGILFIADARAGAARERPPILVPLAALGALAAFVACGQRLGDLPAYLSLQLQEATGYGEAMYLVPSRFELGAFVLGAAGLVALAALCGPSGRGARPAAALGTAATLLLALKAGFVRADTHTQIAWSVLGLAGLAVASGVVLRRSAVGAAALAASSLAVLWVVGPLFLLAATDRTPGLAELPGVYRDMGADLAAETAAWDSFLRSPSRFIAAARAAKAAGWAKIRADQALPRLDGRVDILTSDQSAVLAAGLDYGPRPSFQDYSTYTAGLIAANVAFYAGDRAPDWVLVDVGALDDRHPNSIEGALWPDLLRRYEPQRRIGPWMALHRRATPLPEVLGAPIRLDAALGRRVALPLSGPVFARVTVNETLVGRLAAALFRPPALSLRLVLAGGGEQSYRFIPAIAAGGFLLSPILTGSTGFAALAFGAGAEGAGTDVTALTVGGSPWARLFYDAAVSIELRPVAVPVEPPSVAAAALAGEVARTSAWQRLARAIGRGGQLDGDRLSAPAPTALSVPVAGMRRLKLGFGIADGAWTAGSTQGVCFSVRATPGTARPLWRRCLDPKGTPVDRGPQSAEVELPPGLSAVTAETTCPGSCDWGWSYWDGISSDD